MALMLHNKKRHSAITLLVPLVVNGAVNGDAIIQTVKLHKHQTQIPTHSFYLTFNFHLRQGSQSFLFSSRPQTNGKDPKFINCQWTVCPLKFIVRFFKTA